MMLNFLVSASLLAGAVAIVTDEAPEHKSLCNPGEDLRQDGRKLLCYKLKGGTFKTYIDAEESCAKVNSTLLTITDQKEQDFIIEKYLNKTNVANSSGVWLSMETKDCHSWKDVEESPLTFQHWKEDPNDFCSYMMKSGLWDRARCEKTKRVICKRKMTQGCATDEEEYCDDTNCFCFSHHKEMKTWANASHACQGRGARLASITSAAQQMWLMGKYPPSDVSTWIGLNDFIAEGEFTWVDGEKSNYENYKTEQPDGYTMKENCIHYNIAGCLDDKWNDQNCSEENYYLCKKRVA